MGPPGNPGRFKDPRVGRFVSVDGWGGSPELPQTLDKYVYAVNDPQRRVDPLGEWPSNVHDRILEEAFPSSVLPAADLAIIKAADARQDALLHGGQLPDVAYQHAMRAPFEDAAIAESRYNNFIEENLKEAVLFGALETGDVTIHQLALVALAKNFHAKADFFAPEHRGFQLWNPADPISTSRHIWREQLATVTVADRRPSVDAIVEHYKLYKSQVKQHAAMISVANTGLIGFGSFAEDALGAFALAPGLF